MNLFKDNNLIPSEALNTLRSYENINIKSLFFDLIKQLHDKHGKVVILIDEYDKAILDYMEFHKMAEAKANQAVLALFYGALKEADVYIRLLFITGISKFTRVSLFSKLNNLTDLTIHPDYATIVGYTQDELEDNFVEYIDAALQKFSHYTRAELLAKVRLWYNGYSWDGQTRLYNPSGILAFLHARDFQSFWFQTGTPTHIYFLEFKINSDADTAFKQIIAKKYAAPYTADSRIKVGIGVNFDSPTKELNGWYAEIL